MHNELETGFYANHFHIEYHYSSLEMSIKLDIEINSKLALVEEQVKFRSGGIVFHSATQIVFRFENFNSEGNNN